MKKTKGPSRAVVRELKKAGIEIKQISLDQYEREQKERKKSLGMYDWADSAQLPFPGFFTVHCDYFATGEGRTIGILFCAAATVDELLSRANHAFNAYFASGAEIRIGINPLPEYEHLITTNVQEIVRRFRTNDPKRPPGFSYHAVLHENYS